MVDVFENADSFFRVQFDVAVVLPSVQEDENVTYLLILIYYYELWYE